VGFEMFVDRNIVALYNKLFFGAFVIGLIGLVFMHQAQEAGRLQQLLGDVGAILCCSGFLLTGIFGFAYYAEDQATLSAAGIMPSQQPIHQFAKNEPVNQTPTSQTNMTQPIGADESIQGEQPLKLDVNNPGSDDEGEKKSNFWDNI
tara:strand:+ start:94 stop:534 length:441 start_codon:yes stop_codon:yes gene_type:complete